MADDTQTDANTLMNRIIRRQLGYEPAEPDGKPQPERKPVDMNAWIREAMGYAPDEQEDPKQ